MALTAEQKEARKAGVGGSDVAAILGLSKWKTPLEVYLEKVGELESSNDKEYGEIEDKVDAIHFGNVLEDVVADEFSRRNDMKVVRKNDMIHHKQHDFMLANIDRNILKVDAGLECKTAGAFMVTDWGPSGTDEFPEYYLTQCVHYMNVTESSGWYLAVLIGGNQYRQYYVEQDAELSEMVVKGVQDFWQRVVDRAPPDYDFTHRSTRDLIDRLYPGTNNKTIHLPENLVHWQKVREEAAARIKEDTAVVNACKNRIAATMGENACGIIEGAGIQYKRRKVNKKEFTVAPSSYFDIRASKWAGDNG